MEALAELGQEALKLALSQYTARVQQPNWVVDTVVSPTTITVALNNPRSVKPNVSDTDTTNYKGARIEFITGVLSGVSDVSPSESGTPVAPYGRVSNTISSVSTALDSSGENPVTTMVFGNPLPIAPSPGDRFIVYQGLGTQVAGTVLADQGSAASTPWAVTNQPIPISVLAITVPASATQYIPSAQDFPCLSLDIYGIFVVAGDVATGYVTVHSGGTMTIRPGGQVSMGVF